MWKSIWKWSIFIFQLVYGLIIFGLVIALGFMITSALRTEVNTMNIISLVIGLFSLPGIIISFLTMFDINKKKQFKLTTNCPKCKHLIDLRMEEC